MNYKKLIVMLCLLSLLILPVIGATYTGQLLIPTYTSALTAPESGTSGGFNDLVLSSIKFGDIGNMQGLKSIIYFRNGGPVMPATGESSGQQRFTSTIGNGFIQYNRVYASTYPYTETSGWIALVFDDALDTTLTGPQIITITYTSSPYHIYNNQVGVPSTPTSAAYFGANYVGNPIFCSGFTNAQTSVTNNIVRVFNQHYVVEYPYELGGVLTVDKNDYNSLISIFDSSTSAIIYNENSLNKIDITSQNFINNGKSFIISALTGSGARVNSSVIPTIISNNSYTLTFTPDFPASNQLISSTIHSNNATTGGSTLSELIAIKMYESDDNGNSKAVINSNGETTPQLKSATYPAGINFLKNLSGWWNAYNTSTGYTQDMHTQTTPNPISFSLFTSGVHYITTQIVDQNNYESMIITPISVTGTIGSKRLTIYPVDSSTGDVVIGTTLHVTDMQTNVTQTKTITSINDCWFVVGVGFYKYEIDSVAGYDSTNTGVWKVKYITEDLVDIITLYPSVTSGTLTNTSLYVTVRAEPSLNIVSGANIYIEGYGNKLTAALGSANFIVTNGTALSIRVSANGYQSVSQSYTPSGAVDFVDIVLGEGVVTYITTIPVTPIPTLTRNETVGVTCRTLGANATFIDTFLNFASCQGVKSEANQKIIIGLICIIFFLIIGGKVGGGLGAIVGTIIGYVAGLALGLLPLWTLFAFIVIGGILLGSKIVLANDA